MSSVSRRRPDRAGDTPTAVPALAERWALYCRVSTDDQADRGTIQNQRAFLCQYVATENAGRELQGRPPVVVAGIYEDEGVSGTIALDKRAGGRKLLKDAQAGLFTVVAIYKLDRIGRKLLEIMDAHKSLEAAGVKLRSATENLDTSTPHGTFAFQVMGSVAELERATIMERTIQGRERVGRTGKWTHGPVPTGYTTDAGGFLMPSVKIVDEIGMTEADMARDIFRRLAEGSSAIGICRWLNAAGVKPVFRYATTGAERTGKSWRAGRIADMIRNTAYKGIHTIHARGGAIERDVEALVTPKLWELANRALDGNRSRPPAHTKRDYLLRGVLQCECGASYVGTRKNNGRKSTPVYRCNAQIRATAYGESDRCGAKLLPAEDLETRVWSLVRAVYATPAETIVAEVEEAICERRAEVANRQPQRDALTARLVALRGERDRMLKLYKGGGLSYDDTMASLAETDKETAVIQAELDILRVDDEQDAQEAARLSSIPATVARIAKELERIDGNPTKKRKAILGLVRAITVWTRDAEMPSGRTRKQARMRVDLIVGGRLFGATATLGEGDGWSVVEREGNTIRLVADGRQHGDAAIDTTDSEGQDGLPWDVMVSARGTPTLLPWRWSPPARSTRSRW